MTAAGRLTTRIRDPELMALSALRALTQGYWIRNSALVQNLVVKKNPGRLKMRDLWGCDGEAQQWPNSRTGASEISFVNWCPTVFLQCTLFAIKPEIHFEDDCNAKGLISTVWAVITAKLLSLHIFWSFKASGKSL